MGRDDWRKTKRAGQAARLVAFVGHIHRQHTAGNGAAEFAESYSRISKCSHEYGQTQEPAGIRESSGAQPGDQAWPIARSVSANPSEVAVQLSMNAAAFHRIPASFR